MKRPTAVPLGRRWRASAGLGLAALALSAGLALAAGPGELDPSFDGDGKLVLPYDVWPQDVLAQPDGKLVVTDRNSSTVLRLNADGSPDRSFSGDGLASVDFGAGWGIAAAALLPDGKLMVAGGVGADGIGVARFNANGALDETFGPGGAEGDGKKVYPSTDTGLTSVGAMVMEPAGSIVLAGTSSGDVTAARLKATGDLDKKFELAAGAYHGDHVMDAALAPDGKLVVIASTSKPAATPGGPGDLDEAVIRFKPDGTRDKSFAGTGRAEFGVVGKPDQALAVLVQPDNKIVLAEQSGSYGLNNTWADSRMHVTRLLQDGARDPDFGEGGRASPGFAGDQFAAGAALQADGKILLAGTLVSEFDFAAARFDANGALDPSFGLDGKATVPFDAPSGAVKAVLQPDGRFVMAGISVIEQNAGQYRTALARLLTEPPAVDGGPGGGGDNGDGGEGPGTEEPVVPRCAGKRATIVGTARGETLRGTKRADVIVARGGNDRVLAGGGGDVVCGGAGDDRLGGGAGPDTLAGGAGRDLMAGGRAKDRCTGGPARDRAKSCETVR